MVEVISRRYGQAMFDLALEGNYVEQLEKEIKVILELFKIEDAIFETLNHPKVSTQEKVEVLESIFQKNTVLNFFDKILGTNQLHADLLGFLVVIVRKNRQEYLVDILEYTLKLISTHLGYIDAYVTSAKPLGKEQREAIKAKLEAQTGEKISLFVEVDEALLGGMTIRVGDRIVDSSIKGSIRRMSRELYEVKA